MNAGVAQRTEQKFSKLLDPGSNPVTRSVFGKVKTRTLPTLPPWDRQREGRYPKYRSVQLFYWRFKISHAPGRRGK